MAPVIGVPLAEWLGKVHTDEKEKLKGRLSDEIIDLVETCAEHDLQENSCPVCPEGKLVVGYIGKQLPLRFLPLGCLVLLRGNFFGRALDPASVKQCGSQTPVRKRDSCKIL